ncbi:MAG TPA: ribonuclease Y [Candidatus Coproplasma excrementigallinarum]|uniref:Ribonuclease Y n=1 Tax=Candidatus Coproplasma excrementigallinarum TaxID=2840747 RepID=A0A9D1MIK7_9FIRM|nr:ribonuclease Y [Candidatus Coproplasma excrementigallinarum]
MYLLGISSLFLATAAEIGLGVAFGVAAVAAVIILVLFLIHRNKVRKANEELGEASERAKKMVAEAQAECKALKKEAILEAKEQELKLRNDFERESKEKRAELTKQEQRLTQREDNLDKREDSLTKKSDALEQQKKELANREQEIKKTQDKVNHQHELMVQELEKVAQLTKEEAKTLLSNEILDETRHDVALQVRNIEQTAKEEATNEAKKIITLAIQRCAADHTSETTVSTVSLPSDDMKARIIGREGRNIRALENATGIEFIIDDTPEVVILSGFDPIRREVARLSLEKLIADGRIHPARIEETVEKVKKELDQEIKQAGESAMFEVGIFGLHPELIKLIGRLKYRTSYGQNVYQHSIEVALLAGLMAQELGLDVNFAKRAGLLHDIGKAVDHEQEGTHIRLGADLAKKYKENANIVNAIEAHHGDVEPKTVEAVLVAAADAISGARPGARRETGTNYVKRLEKLEEIASSFRGVDKSYAIQAGREVRVMVKPDQIDDAQALFLAKDIAKKIESELEYPGQIKVNVIREFRSVEYAK